MALVMASFEAPVIAGSTRSLLTSDIAIDKRGELSLAESADLLRGHDAVLEQEQRRYAADAELGGH